MPDNAAMLNAADNEILVRTNAGTPMGDYFRRFWLPVALCSEMPAPTARRSASR